MQPPAAVPVLSAVLAQTLSLKAEAHYAGGNAQGRAEAWMQEHWHQAYDFLVRAQGPVRRSSGGNQANACMHAKLLASHACSSCRVPMGESTV